MGFQLFTTSGTFNPASWGLKAGDVLQIVCVGGGGGGSYMHYESTTSTSYQGSAGSASSFGSIISSAGGKGGNTAQTSMEQVGANRGGQVGSVSVGGYWYQCGGSGADGWLPGHFGESGQIGALYLPWFPDTVSGSSSSISSKRPNGLLGANQAGISAFYGKRDINITYATSRSGIKTASTSPYGYAGTCLYPQGSGHYAISVGGAGYGAGGGGASPDYTDRAYGTGGNSGVINIISYALSNTNTIAVTVGNGGAGAPSGGGGGARGCVAVYW